MYTCMRECECARAHVFFPHLSPSIYGCVSVPSLSLACSLCVKMCVSLLARLCAHVCVFMHARTHAHARTLMTKTGFMCKGSAAESRSVKDFLHRVRRFYRTAGYINGCNFDHFMQLVLLPDRDDFTHDENAIRHESRLSGNVLYLTEYACDV